MYSIKNGILYHDTIPQIALGQSYYPSYHVQKVPLPKEADRLGEMAIDLKEMRQAGFNLCRVAALEEVKMEADTLSATYEIADAFCELCEQNDMAAMVRLQGYSVNLSALENATMLNEKGQAMPFHWSWFVRNCMNHPQVLKDNERLTTYSAEHFSQFPSVVSYQIYNEPAYPTEGFYDYHPATLTAFRTWLVEQKQFPPERAADYPIYRARPQAGEPIEPWILFRLFQSERLNHFLGEMSDAAKRTTKQIETLTCHLGTPFNPGNAIRGVDYFINAQTMDIVGITHYVPFRGPSFFKAAVILDAAESIAAAQGKHAWIIELNARTNIPPLEWERETFAVLARGFKGILYYEWRADFPYPDSPEPEAFGMLYNNKTKTQAYETGIACNALINSLSKEFARCEKVRSQVGILYSMYATCYFDAIDNQGCNGAIGAHDRYGIALNHAYAALAKEAVVVDVLRSEDLATNPLGITTLIIPMIEGLSEEELDAVDAFIGQVYVYRDEMGSFTSYTRKPQPRKHGIVYDDHDAKTLVDVLALHRPISVGSSHPIDARVLESDEMRIICLVNYDSLEREQQAIRLDCSFPCNNAVWYDLANPQGKPIKGDGTGFCIEALRSAACIVIPKEVL